MIATDQLKHFAGQYLKTSITLASVVILSLTTWAFFYLSGLPLGAPETIVVVGLCALMVWLVKFTWQRLGQRPKRSLRKRAKVKRNVEHP